MTLDLLLLGGTVVDGTGAPARHADVGVAGGKVVAIGDDLGDAHATVDCDGKVVAPGVIDLHTHYDAQLLWDGAATPSPLHGVTTVIGGNCGFSIAPLAPDHADYLRRMMARVEGIPLAALEAGTDWGWRGFGEYLERLDGRLAVNAGFLAGHSTIRRLVMGDDAHAVANADQIEQMVAIVHDAMAQGALGFSSSLGEAHTDGDGEPVPSRGAAPEEFLALAAAVRDHAGTTLEFIAAMGEIPLERAELMAEMSLAADRPLNWNLLGSLSPVEVYEQQLTACDLAASRGATVVALALPDLLRMRSDRVLRSLPGWEEVWALPDAERARALADPAVRDRLHTGFDEASARGLSFVADWDLVEIAEAGGAASEGCAGRTVREIAATRGVDPFTVLLDVVVADRAPLTTVFPSLTPSYGVSDEGWAIRRDVWSDPRVVLGGSDAGAHVDLMCHANYPTVVLGELVRERGMFTLEDAVRRITDVPARLLGLRGRGRVATGYEADLFVFDPATVATAPTTARRDLPGGAERLSADAIGVEHVFVGGVATVHGSQLTGALPGTALRSGRDTDTVKVPGGPR